MAKQENASGNLTVCQVLIITVLLLSSTVATATAGVYEIGFLPMVTSSASSKICEGSIGDCLGGDEFELDSESNRRLLAYRRRYISYGALNRDKVPCSRRGKSYYNCGPGAPATPYKRGCSAITRCRG